MWKLLFLLMFQTNLWFGIGFVKFKIYLSGTSKCSLKTIVVFIYTLEPESAIKKISG